MQPILIGIKVCASSSKAKCLHARVFVSRIYPQSRRALQSVHGTKARSYGLKMNLSWIDLSCCCEKNARAAKEVRRTREAKNASHRMAKWNTNREYNKETTRRKCGKIALQIAEWLTDWLLLLLSQSHSVTQPFQLALKMVRNPKNV